MGMYERPSIPERPQPTRLAVKKALGEVSIIRGIEPFGEPEDDPETTTGGWEHE